VTELVDDSRYETLHRALRRVREKLLPSLTDPDLDLDLSFVLAFAERFQEVELRALRAEALIEAARAAYEAVGPKTKTAQRQAAACRALGLTSPDGKRPGDPWPLLWRWLELTSGGQREADEALEVLHAEGFGNSPGACARRLRKIKEDLKSELQRDSLKERMRASRKALLDALSTGPAKVPDGRDDD